MIIRMKDFQMPKELQEEGRPSKHDYGRFVAEPFERGFGITIGNALRRAMLSSIVGAAVTAVKIEGVLHEFATIPGVKEDVTDIILNIKKVRVKLHADKDKTIHIKKKGPGEVCAKDIVHDADVEILTPDLHLATLDRHGRLEIEMVVRPGRGYAPAEKNKEDSMPIGVVPIDASFSPVKKVNFTVENARVGRVTDYDKLILDVWTDGSITPMDAIGYAAKILKDHLTIFITFKEEDEPRQLQKEETTESNKHLLKSINELELSVRAANCLKNANIRTIADLVQKQESEMLKMKNFGRKSLNEIKGILGEMSLSFGMHLPASLSKTAEKEEV